MDRSIRTLITDFLRSDVDEENIQSRTAADTVLMTYQRQYHVEHAFRLMKDGMMFVISLATMPSDIITHVLKSNGIGMTMQSISGTMSALDIVQDDDGEYLDGSEEHIDLFMRMLESLRIDPDHLLGRCAVAHSGSGRYAESQKINRDVPNSRFGRIGADGCPSADNRHIIHLNLLVLFLGIFTS